MAATETVTVAVVGPMAPDGQRPSVTEPPGFARMAFSQAFTPASRMELAQMRVFSRFSVSTFGSSASAAGMVPVSRRLPLRSMLVRPLMSPSAAGISPDSPLSARDRAVARPPASTVRPDHVALIAPAAFQPVFVDQLAPPVAS